MGPALMQPASRGVWRCGHGASPALRRDSLSLKLPRALMGEDRNSGWAGDGTKEPCCDPAAGWERLSPPGSHARSGQGSLAHTFPAQLPTLPPPAPPPQATAPQMAPIKGLCFVTIFPK